jgi:hypothetical protein
MGKEQSMARIHRTLEPAELPAVTVPVTAADPMLDKPDQEWLNYVPRNEADAFNHAQCKFLPNWLARGKSQALY